MKKKRLTVKVPRWAIGELARRLEKDGLSLSQYFQKLIAEDLKNRSTDT
jgi:hypothetical protein